MLTGDTFEDFVKKPEGYRYREPPPPQPAPLNSTNLTDSSSATTTINSQVHPESSETVSDTTTARIGTRMNDSGIFYMSSDSSVFGPDFIPSPTTTTTTTDHETAIQNIQSSTNPACNCGTIFGGNSTTAEVSQLAFENLRQDGVFNRRHRRNRNRNRGHKFGFGSSSLDSGIENLGCDNNSTIIGNRGDTADRNSLANSSTTAQVYGIDNNSIYNVDTLNTSAANSVHPADSQTEPPPGKKNSLFNNRNKCKCSLNAYVL